MKSRRAVNAVLLCLLVVVLMVTFVQEAHAKPFDSNGAKTGLGEVFKSRAATGVGPNKVQFGVTIAATVIMLAVLKYV